MHEYVQGSVLLLKFYFQEISTICNLPYWLRNPHRLSDRMEAYAEESENTGKDDVTKSRDGEKYVLALNEEQEKLIVGYNDRMNILKGKLRRLHEGSPPIEYSLQLLLLNLVRIACIFSAWYGSFDNTIAISLAQVLIAPYSFFVSFGLAIALAPPIYLPHYVVFFLLQSLVDLVFSPSFLSLINAGAVLSIDDNWTSMISNIHQYLHIEITGKFVIAFFVIDQLLCIYCHWFKSDVIEMPLKKTLTHIVWGFLNCKTYYLVLLLHMWKLKVSFHVLPWVLDYVFGIIPKVADFLARNGTHWAELFYHQHRMAHLPRVYEHAHKLHHYLKGSTAFDAHIYGNGMQEELFLLWFDLLMSCLYLSWTNKIGHTQSIEDTRGQNFHTDHHLKHIKNFGIYSPLLDMTFDTAYSNSEYFYTSLEKSKTFKVLKTKNKPEESEGKCTTFTFELLDKNLRSKQEDQAMKPLISSI